MGVPKMKSGIGTVKFDLGGGVWDERDAEDLADDPVYGGVAHEALWKRDMKSARDEADSIGLELSNPSRRRLSKTERDEILAVGSQLQETDPRHKELKSKLVADDEMTTWEQKQWEAKKRAQELARMGPKGYQQYRQQQKLQSVAQASQDITKQEADIQAKDAEGVSGRDLQAHQAAKQDILAKKQDIQKQAQSIVVPDKRVTAVTQNGVTTEYDPNTQPKTLDDYDNDLNAAEQKILDAEKSGQADPASISAAKAELAKNRGMIASARKESGEAEARKTAIESIGVGFLGKEISGKKAGLYEKAKDYLNDVGIGGILHGAVNPLEAAQVQAIDYQLAIERATGDLRDKGYSKEDAKRIIEDAAKEYAWTADTKDSVRELSSGSMAINPALIFGDNEALKQKIQSTGNNPEKQSEALERLDAMRKAMAKELKGQLYSADYDFKAFADERKGTDDVTLLDEWRKSMADRNGIVKFTDVVLNEIANGGYGVIGTGKNITAGVAAMVGADQIAGSVGRSANKLNQYVEQRKMTQVNRGLTGTYGVIGDVTNTATQMVPMLVGGEVAMAMKPLAATLTRVAAVEGTAFLQGAGSKYQDAVDLEKEKLGRELSNDEIAEVLGRRETKIAAFSNGAQTALLNRMLPGGPERIVTGGAARSMTVLDFLSKGGRKAIRDAGLKAELKQIGKTMFADAKDEMIEEGINQMLDGIISTAALGKDMKLGDLLEESFHAAMLGGLVGGVLPQARFSKAEKTAAALVAQGEAAPTPEEQRKVDEVAGTDADVDQQVQYTKAQREIAAAEPEVAERATATLKLARGASIEELTSSERSAIGINEDGVVIDPENNPFIKILDNGKIVIKDGAIQELEAVAPAAKGLVTMTEGEARTKFSKQPFTVTSKSGVTIQVEAKDAEEAQKIGAQQFKLGDPVETVTLAATGEANVGTSATPAPAPTGTKTAQPVADQTAIDQTVQKLRTRLGKLVNITNDPSVRVHAVPDLIKINPEALKAEAAANGLDDAQAAKWISDVVDEEVRHLAQHSAARDLYAQSGDKRDFEEWRDEHYAMVWNTEFVATGKDAMVRKLYGAGLDSLPEWKQAMEGIRMMWQRKENGNPTELAKLWTNLSAAMVEELKAVLRQLRAMVKNLTPEMKRELALLQSKLKEIENEQNNKGPAKEQSKPQAPVQVQPMPVGAKEKPVAAPEPSKRADAAPAAPKAKAENVAFAKGDIVTGVSVNGAADLQGKTFTGTIVAVSADHAIVNANNGKAIKMAFASMQKQEAKGQKTSQSAPQVAETPSVTTETPAAEKDKTSDIPSATLTFPSRSAAQEFATAWGRHSTRGHDMSATKQDGTTQVTIYKLSGENKKWVDSYVDQKTAETPKATEKPKKTAGPKKSRIGRALPRHLELFMDSRIGKALYDSGGIMSKSTALQKYGAEYMAENGSNWQDAPTITNPVFNKYIFGSKNSNRPDQVAKALFDIGVIKDDSAKELWAELGRALQSTRSVAEQEKTENVKLSQAEDFARVKDDGPYRVNVDEMSVGDKLVIDGENFTVTTVTRKDGEVAKVILEDGTRFGRQTVEGGEDVWVEEFDDGTPEMTADDAAERDAADQARIPQSFVDSLKKGDRFQDEKGDIFEVWFHRQGNLQAHPVINNKPVVNNQSGVMFATTNESRLRNPEYKVDIKEPEWMPFEKSLGIPRSEMPQIKASDRAAMVQFLKARGIDYREETIPASRLKATQVEYSPEKVRNYEGGDRSILISGDGYVVDGHHQWLAAGDGDIKVIRLLAPIRKVLATVSEMPSVETSEGEKPEPVATKPAEPTLAQLNDPSYFSQRVIQEIDDAIAQYTSNGKRKISDVFGKSEESRRVKMFIERGNAIRSYAINTKAAGPEATFRININKATTFAELRDAAVKLHSKLTAPKLPATKMDVAQTNAKELFADDGGFTLAQQTTQDGDKVAKAKADAEAAKEAADKAQGKLFDLTAAEKATEKAFEGLFAAPLATNPFYSQLAKAIEQKMPKVAPVAQVVAIARDNAKAEEVKWSGIIQAAQEMAVDGKVSKDALLVYLANEGAVKFEEVTLGEVEYRPKVSATPSEAEVKQFLELEIARISEIPEEERSIGEQGELEDYQEALSTEYFNPAEFPFLHNDNRTITHAKYAQYVLPGGENYREVVLAMPLVKTVKPYAQWLKENFTGEDTPQARELYAIQKQPGANYTSSHFPDVPNYVAHMRTNERTDADGNAGLFIEEIQSDRHQEGRKKGYSAARWTAEEEARVRELELPRPYPGLSQPERDEYAALMAKEAQSGIADAPFRTTWPLAMFKRALRDAVASGKSWIGWTTGDTQNDRFDLSKELSRISYESIPDTDLFEFEAFNKQGETVISEDEITIKRVEELAGKDIAEKVLAREGRKDDGGYRDWHHLEGLDLKVGGSGMKGFYDNMLPKEIGKYVKQWGGKVEKTELVVSPERKTIVAAPNRPGGIDKVIPAETAPIWRIDITPEMRAGVAQGQMLFAAPLSESFTENIPADKIGGMINAASQLIADGVRTPEAMAAALTRIEQANGKPGALRKYSEAFWSAFRMVDTTLAKDVDWAKVYEPASQNSQNEPEVNDEKIPLSTPSEILTLSRVSDFFSKLKNGDVTANQVKTTWEQFKNSKFELKKELAKMTMAQLARFQGMRKPASKSDAVNSAYNSLESKFNPTDSLSYMMSGDMKKAHADAMDAKVALWTDDLIAQKAGKKTLGENEPDIEELDPEETPAEAKEREQEQLAKTRSYQLEKMFGPHFETQLQGARNLWKTEKEWRYNALLRLRETIATLLMNVVGTNHANGIATAMIEGTPTIIDKILAYQPIKEIELKGAGIYPSSITRLGYERGDRAVYSHPKGAKKDAQKESSVIDYRGLKIQKSSDGKSYEILEDGKAFKTTPTLREAKGYVDRYVGTTNESPIVLWGRHPNTTDGKWVRLTDNTSNAEVKRRESEGWEVMKYPQNQNPSDIEKPPVDPLPETAVESTADIESFSPEQAASELAKRGITVEKGATKTGKPVWEIKGKTFDVKDALKSLGAKWYNPKKSWSIYSDDNPTQKIADALAGKSAQGEVPQGSPDGSRASGNADEDLRLRELRERLDSNPDERGTRGDAISSVDASTAALIRRGLSFGMPQSVVDDQIEDVAMITRAFTGSKPMFLLGNGAGTGKTFVLGGAIREMRSKGATSFVYVTMSTDLIDQIKKDLSDFGIQDVNFHTYSEMSSKGIDMPKGSVLIFDEAHNVKNEDSSRGGVAQGMMGDAKFTVFASATPFENPVEAGYVAGTGIFNQMGGHTEFAKAYGANVRKVKGYDKNGGQIEKEYVYWTAGKLEDGIAARQWFTRQGIMITRPMQLPLEMVESQFSKHSVDKKWVAMYNNVEQAYDDAMSEFRDENGNILDARNNAMVSMHMINTVKRILEASKVEQGVKRAQEILNDGGNVVLFVETKADRWIGRYRASTLFDKKSPLYTYPQMREMMDDWEAEAAIARKMSERPGPRPFAESIMSIARAMHSAGIEYELPSVEQELVDQLGGKDKVGVYTGSVTSSAASKDKAAFLAGQKKVIVATMAKGGTGLSLHDRIGDRPTSQINLNLPWKASGVDQVSARVARYGLQSKAYIEWLFADNIPFERSLAYRVGRRMRDMGAIVKGVDTKAANVLSDGFDFEGSVDVKQVGGEVKVAQTDIFEQAERLEKSRRQRGDQSNGFFETPFTLSALMTVISGARGRLLEPSAGRGNLVRFAKDSDAVISITMVEQRADNADYLEGLFVNDMDGARNQFSKSIVIRGDFLDEAAKLGKFDSIHMNPPFERKAGVGAQDVAHVMQAYDLLSDDGRLVAIMGEGAFFRSTKQEQEFRQWLNEVGAIVVKLPENAFKNSNTGVRARMVIIDRNADSGRTDINLDDMSADSLRSVADAIPTRQSSDTLSAAPLSDRARSEMDEGGIKETMAQQKEFGNVVKPPNRASMGDETTRKVVDVFDIDFEQRREKESREQWVKQGTKKAATGRKDLIENALMNAYGEVGAVPMMPEDMIGTQIVIEQMVQEAGNNYDKLIEAGTIIQAYRKVRGDIARVLASGWDRLMPPDERNRRYLANAILTLPPTIERDISKRGYSPEKTRELIQEELRNRLTSIEKALKEYGVTINEVLGKQVYLSLNKKNIVKDIMAKNTKDEQLAIRMHQQATDVQKIAKATHMTVAEVQKLIDRVYNEALERMKVKARAGATLESLQAAALSEAEVEAEARRMVEIGLGISPTAHTSATRMMKRKAIKVPTEPEKVNWARPEFTSGLLDYSFDTKDLDSIKQTVQALIDATAAKAKVESITDPKQRAKADALLAKLETILAKYGTDISSVVESGKPLESYRFDITDRVHVHIVANAIRSVDADWIDKGTEYAYFSMLSGLQTLAVNASSVMHGVMDATIGRGFEMITNAFLNRPENATLGEVKYMVRAMGPILTRAKSNFMASFGAEAPFFEQDILGVPPDLEKVLEGHGMYHRTAISGQKGRLLRIPTRLLLATDEFVKTINAMAEVGAMAYRLCRAAKLTPGTKEFEEKIKELVNVPGSLAWQLAAKKAYQRTFTNPLPGETDPVTGKPRPVRTGGEWVGSLVGDMQRALSKDRGSMEAKLAQTLLRLTFVPFVKIPYNITALALTYTPASLIEIAQLYARNRKAKDKMAQAEVIERLSRVMLGGTLTAMLLGMGEGDDDDLEKGILVTGSRPYNDTKKGVREAGQRLGVDAYSISWPTSNGKRGVFHYGRIEPLATILATTIDTLKEFKKSSQGKQAYGEALGSIITGFTDQLSDKTFLKGLGDLRRVWVGETDMSRFAADKLGMLIPNMIKQPLRESDESFRDKGNSFGEELAYALFPYGQKEAKVNFYGEESKKLGSPLTRWFDFTDAGSVTTKPLDEMLWRYQQKFPNGETLPADASPTYSLNGKQQKMTENQAAMYRKQAGQVFTARLPRLSLNYKNPTDRDIKAVQKLIDESRDIAKKILIHKPDWK